MRIIDTKEIEQAVETLYTAACCDLPADVEQALARSKESETNPLACEILKELLDNAKIARDEQMPCCQDTGMPIVFAEIGADVHIQGVTLQQAVDAGIRAATCSTPLRASVLHPLTRVNTKDNTPAILHLTHVKGEELRLTIMPKGFGSENMGRVCMLKPSQGVPALLDFVVESVRLAGGNPCPPLLVGVGIGGTLEYAGMLAKRALLRPVGSAQHDPQLAKIESELLSRINALNIGPMGLGGDTTALAVHAVCHPTHIAGLPVAVNLSCHAARHREVIL